MIETTRPDLQGTGMVLTRLLLLTGAEVESRLERCLEPFGLSLAKLGVLYHLVQSDGALPLGQLAERLSCVKSNVTQLVDRLEADGLVQRVPDPDDRRSVLARITEQGERLCELGWKARQDAEYDILEPLTFAEREQLANLLEQLRESAA